MSFFVTILGSASALPTKNRFTTAQVLNVQERFFLIDCGEGTQIQLRKAKVKFLKINHIFISHMHGDHMFGLPGLISTFSLLGRKTPLHIHAHKDMRRVMGNYLGYFEKNLQFEIVYHDLDYTEPKVIFEDAKVEVLSLPLKHRIPSCGFIVKEKPLPPHLNMDMIETYSIPGPQRGLIKAGRDYVLPSGEVIPNSKLVVPAREPKKYVYCSDTAYSEKYLDYVRGADLLYHETTFLHEDIKMAKKTGHSTTLQAAKFAKLTAVKHLAIGHYSSRYKDNRLFVEETKSVFKAVSEAKEMKVYEV